MEKSLLEKKIVELETQLEEWTKFDAGILENLMDQGSTIVHESGSSLYLPIEKLNYLIKELEKMRYRIEKLDLLYEIEYEILNRNFSEGSKILKKEEDVQLGLKIKNIRAELGDDQKEFSQKIKSTVSALSNWENGRNKPNDIMLKRIADLGGITVDELLYGTCNE